VIVSPDGAGSGSFDAATETLTLTLTPPPQQQPGPASAVVAAGQYLGANNVAWEVGDLRVRDLGQGNVLLQFAAYAPGRPYLVLGSPLTIGNADTAAPLFAVVTPDDPVARQFADAGIVARSTPTGFNVEISDVERLKAVIG